MMKTDAEEEGKEKALEIEKGEEEDSDTQKLLSDSHASGSIVNIDYTNNEYLNRRIGFCEFICAFTSLFVIDNPKKSFCVVFSLLLGLLLAVNLSLSNDKFNFEDIIENDYSSIISKYDLSVGKIDHWCLTGGNEKCKCEDPLTPVSKSRLKFWQRAHELNKNDITNFLSKVENTNLDVLFIGENIAESWAGRSVGMNTSHVSPIGQLFKSNFDKNSGGSYTGLSLGIAGDTTPNVLWRIQNDELPALLEAKVIWLVVGSNDLAIKQCSEEVVLLGILRVIEEIQSLKPNAKIVVNSIVPMTTDGEGRVPDIVPIKAARHKAKAGGGRRALRPEPMVGDLDEFEYEDFEDYELDSTDSEDEEYYDDDDDDEEDESEYDHEDEEEYDYEQEESDIAEHELTSTLLQQDVERENLPESSSRRMLKFRRGKNKKNKDANEVEGEGKKAKKGNKEKKNRKNKKGKSGKGKNKKKKGKRRRKKHKNKRGKRRSDDDYADDDATDDQKKEILRKPVTDGKRKKKIFKRAKDKTPVVKIKDHFVRVRVSMWPSVVAINEQLKRFCSKHKHVVFFDSYDVFIDRVDSDIPMLKGEYYKSFTSGSPSSDGHKAWMEAIISKLKSILKKEEEKKEEEESSLASSTTSEEVDEEKNDEQAEEVQTAEGAKAESTEADTEDKKEDVVEEKKVEEATEDKKEEKEVTEEKVEKVEEKKEGER